MNVDLWVTALRILATVLAMSIFWPNLLEPWRWSRSLHVKADTRGSRDECTSMDDGADLLEHSCFAGRHHNLSGFFRSHRRTVVGKSE